MSLLILFAFSANAQFAIRALNANHSDFADYLQALELNRPGPKVSSEQIDNLLRLKHSISEFWRLDWPKSAIPIFSRRLEHMIRTADSLAERKKYIDILAARSASFKNTLPLKQFLTPREIEELNHIRKYYWDVTQIQDHYKVYVDSELVLEKSIEIPSGHHRISFYSDNYQSEHYLLNIQSNTFPWPKHISFAKGNCLNPKILVHANSRISHIFYSKNCVLDFENGTWVERNGNFIVKGQDSLKALEDKKSYWKSAVLLLMGICVGIVL